MQPLVFALNMLPFLRRLRLRLVLGDLAQGVTELLIGCVSTEFARGLAESLPLLLVSFGFRLRHLFHPNH